jgi:dihydrofolate synthase/folylpolyglutamate synthase
MDISEALSFFVTHHHEWSLAPITAVLEKLGNPHHRLPPTFYITGTNGKGSTSAFLFSCLKEAGLRVHRYTSPHLVDWTERIVLANTEILTETLVHYLRECARHQVLPLSTFEALTAAAFLAFDQHPADALIVEVGMGGRLDATNILPASCMAACLMTPISLDHTQSLGPTISDITREKVEILRPHVPCVSSTQPLEAAALIAGKAECLQAPLFQEGVHWTWEIIKSQSEKLEIPRKAELFKDPLSVTSDEYSPGFQLSLWDGYNHTFPRLGLVGDHQKLNASTAVAALHAQKMLTISEESITLGLEKASWPGRLHRVTEKALCQWFPQDYELWIDGAHNEGGARILKHHIQTYWQDGRPLVLVMGMLARKDSETFWNLLAPLAQEIWIIDSFDDQETTSSEIFLEYSSYAPVHCFSRLDTLLQDQEHTNKFESHHPRILFCGSLYLIGNILNLIKNKIDLF